MTQRQEDAAEITRRDPIGTLDAYLASVASRGDDRFYRGGYMLWPNPRKAEAAAVKLMTIGNSTSLWPDSDWSRKLAEMLAAEGVECGLFHGAGKGNSSSQELIRVIRDAPAIGANAIVSLSGICDIGHLLNSVRYPFAHKYLRRLLGFAQSSGLARDITYGYPDPASPAQVWCRNQRLVRAAGAALGLEALVFLQPVQGFGPYPMTEAEQAFYAEKAAVVLLAIDKPYGQCVTEFYEEVRAIMAADPGAYDHVVDITDAFAATPGAYRDHRHQSPIGVERLARVMLPHVRDLLGRVPSPGVGKSAAPCVATTTPRD